MYFFDGNRLDGSIPSTIGLVEPVEVLRLDRIFLKRSVPQNLYNLTNLIEMNLAHNMLSGPLPNLTGIDSPLDMSNYFKQTAALD